MNQYIYYTPKKDVYVIRLINNKANNLFVYCIE